jgi:transposase
MEPLRRKVEKKINKKVHHIPYDILHTAIRSVGYQRRVGDVKVNPMYTSQTCFHCFVIDGSYRKGRIFVCEQCGLTVNADRNASGVIALAPLQERPQARHLGPVSRRDGRVNGHVWDHDGGRKTGRGPVRTPEPKSVNSHYFVRFSRQ